MDLVRIARYMVGKEDWAVHQQIGQFEKDLVQLTMTTDSDWGSDEDSRSTSAVRILLHGYKSAQLSV